jgi:hypothetical protein
MAGLSRIPTLAAAIWLVVAGVGCAPEVVIARSRPADGGSSGAASGTAGAETSGTGAAAAAGGAVAAIAGAGGEAGDINVEAPRLLADSVADFSLEQGKFGWQYGYDGGALESFALMTRTDVIKDYVPVTGDVWDCWGNDETHWVQIFRLGAHPNGTDTSAPSAALLQRAVRRWLSSFDGNVVISGEIAKIDLVGSNGVDAFVYVDGTLLYSKLIAGDDGGGTSYQVPATLHVGSSVDFVLDPHEGSDPHDLSRFTGVIARDQMTPIQ